MMQCPAIVYRDTLKAFAGGRIDIHSGGVDLRLPHHDNEIAQSEACFGCKQVSAVIGTLSSGSTASLGPVAGIR